MTQDEHDDLRDLAWRYAAIAGIIDYEDIGLTEAGIEADRLRWPDLYRVIEGLPEFDDDRGAAYMAEVSGSPLADCKEVLLEEWPPPDKTEL